MARVGTAYAVVGLGLALAAPVAGQDVQQKAAAAKQAAAENQQALRAYSWLEKTEIVFRGEVKNTKVQACRYGADGKVEKTTVVEPPPPEAKRGLRGRIIEKKTGEMKEDMETAAALVHQYVPPAPEKIQASLAAGKITIVPSVATTTVRIADYLKPGDALVLGLGTADKGLKAISVDTWKDSPSDKVALKVTMQSLPDGTDYAGTLTLSVPASKVEVRITNSHYQKIQ
ncbi:MAG: hypothetical protein U0599_23880 [Vicinamibacteria bacterium]